MWRHWARGCKKGLLDVEQPWEETAAIALGEQELQRRAT